ncbi:hypothetical protein GYMLUDRAFT_177781, partial [Collybiopsis luxurians FD-317 M1]
KPNITNSLSDRVQIAAAAIGKAMSMFNTSAGLFSDPTISFGTSGDFYSQLAEFDLATNDTTYQNIVQSYFPLAEAARPGLSDEFSNGYAAIRAYKIYNNSIYLAYAEECWNSNEAYALSDSDVSGGTISTKIFPYSHLVKAVR